jgi:hypothetical protein
MKEAEVGGRIAEPEDVEAAGALPGLLKLAPDHISGRETQGGRVEGR